MKKIIYIILLISLLFNGYFLLKKDKTTISTKVIVTEKIDTLRDTVPQLKYKKLLSVIKDTFSNVEYIHDTVNNTDIAVVDIPIEQKVFSDDSTYKAWVSGYKSKLDSIDVFKKTITIDRTTTIVKKDNKRFGIGPIIYGGYSIPNKGFDYGVGIGITYSIFKW